MPKNSYVAVHVIPITTCYHATKGGTSGVIEKNKEIVVTGKNLFNNASYGDKVTYLTFTFTLHAGVEGSVEQVVTKNCVFKAE